MLSPESSAEPGQWSTDRVPYLREIMDFVNEPDVESCVFMKPTQIGGTETANNIVGYIISEDPGPILIIEPTIELARTWSRDRLSPMLRDSPKLRGKVKDARSRDADNSMLHKVFPGGVLSVAGANSPASLASRPIRILLCDEVDKYPPSAGVEGDPVKLAEKRTETFWNRKHFYLGTPTVKKASRIEALYELTDKRKWNCPCPKCGALQVLKWSQVFWEEGKPETAVYICEHCREELSDLERIGMVRSGEWIAERPGRRIRGYWLNGLNSLWKSLPRMVEDYLEAKKHPETYKVWINTFLAETWEEAGLIVEYDNIMSRLEEYGPKIPRQVCLLTAGVDVQDDRIEAEIIGWGPDEESWGIRFEQFVGIPSRPDVWHKLDSFLEQTFEHELGIKMRIGFTLIDSGGHFTQDVYKFVRPRESRRIYTCKGINIPGQPIDARFVVSKQHKIKLFKVGTDTAKNLIYSRLKTETPGPGFMHYPRGKEFGYDSEYFKQLTAEKAVTKFRHGFPYRYWEKIRPRNEALDVRVYGMAALAYTKADLKKMSEYVQKQARLANRTPEEKAQEEEQKKNANVNSKITKQSGGGFVTSW